jgi:hypothetical protein
VFVVKSMPDLFQMSWLSWGFVSSTPLLYLMYVYNCMVGLFTQQQPQLATLALWLYSVLSTQVAYVLATVFRMFRIQPLNWIKLNFCNDGSKQAFFYHLFFLFGYQPTGNHLLYATSVFVELSVCMRVQSSGFKTN